MVYVVNLLNDPGYDLTYDLALMLVRLWLLASCSFLRCVRHSYEVADGLVGTASQAVL